MKDSLKNFINQHRDEFDDKQPGPHVWDRIQSHLPGMKQISLWNSVALWRVAALLFLGLSIFLFATKTDLTTDKQTAKQLHGEFNAIESFYVDEIARKVDLIDDFGGGFQNDQFTQDIEKLDAMYQVLRDEWKVRPTEKVRDALILNILVRIDLLNQQIKHLEDQKSESPKSEAAA